MVKLDARMHTLRNFLNKQQHTTTQRHKHRQRRDEGGVGELSVLVTCVIENVVNNTIHMTLCRSLDVYVKTCGSVV
jgi:hypothetical protein